MKGEGR
jgi:hypothetical protein